MGTRYHCQNQRRLQLLRTQPGARGNYLNGIDYLEVSDQQKILEVRLLRDLPAVGFLGRENVTIEGSGLPKVIVETASSAGDRLTLRVQVPNNLSAGSKYALRLVESPDKLLQQQIADPTDLPPPPGFDPQLSQIQFAFGSEGNSEFDCRAPEAPAEPGEPPPAIDYLAKDYASFRQLILDHLSVILPQWQERSPADIGVMLVEILAHQADFLSYYQDAIATEAYLGTARKRISLRRHARLLDYRLHEGCNARTWVSIEVDAPQVVLPGLRQARKVKLPPVQFLTEVKGLSKVLRPQERVKFLKGIAAGAEVFELLEEGETTLYQACNEIQFYTWGDQQCQLPEGATRATLKDSGGQLGQYLTAGRVLILQEKLNPETGKVAGADLSRRHAVRLTKVIPKEDPLFAETQDGGQPQRVVEVEWPPEDALPFALCLSTVIDERPLSDVSIALGNVVLVDHGRTVPATALPPRTADTTNQDGRILDEEKWNQVPESQPYRPHLQRPFLTQQGQVRQGGQGRWVAFDPQKSAAAALHWEIRNARPSITLKEVNPLNNQEFDWTWQRDLLNSDRFAQDFVIETEDDGRAYLRFGDGVLGKRPEALNYLQVTYRIGNGAAGNIGAGAIAHIVTELDSIRQASNPLPASGGKNPESLEKARLRAAQAFRTPQRAVTEADYAKLATRDPEVQKAVATRRWTGSWYTIFLTVDRVGGRPIDRAFKQKLGALLEPLRLAGHDLEIEAPQFVPLDIALKVQVRGNYFRSAVKESLLKILGNGVLSDGSKGFFHPDNLSFAQPLYLSDLIATAMKVEGVRSVTVERFQRRQQPSPQALKTGKISLGPLEIATDNDPTVPDRGRLELKMEGGL